MFILNGLIRLEIKGSEDREFVGQKISHEVLTVGRQFYYRVLTFEDQFTRIIIYTGVRIVKNKIIAVRFVQNKYRSYVIAYVFLLATRSPTYLNFLR